MKELTLKPYVPVKDEKLLDPIKINLTANQFTGVDEIEGKFTFSFINCDIKEIVIENEEDIDFEITFSFLNCYISDFSIEKIHNSNISLNFGSSVVSGKINCLIKHLSFNNCIIRYNMFAMNVISVSISYTEENIFILRWLELFKRNGIKKIEAFINSGQSYHLENVKHIRFIGNEIDNVKRGIYRRRDEKKLEYKIGYYLTDEQKKKFIIKLAINYKSDFADEETKINGALLNSLSIQGKPNGKIYVEDSKIQRFYIHNFSPQNEFTLYNISPLDIGQGTAQIEIHKSNLDNTWFDNIDFNLFGIISFFRTRFNKTTFTSCNFPLDSISFEKFKSLENIHYPEKLKQNFYKDQYETFLQLKNALENTGNFYEAQKLHAISHEALKKIDDVSKWDKFILLLNYHSNNHGLSIYKPVKLFIIISISLYILYLTSLDRMFNTNEINYDLIGYYFSFIDLTHRSDFLVSKSSFNSLSLILDFLNKIVGGYLIYQFIAAFRKYGKK